MRTEILRSPRPAVRRYNRAQIRTNPKRTLRHLKALRIEVPQTPHPDVRRFSPARTGGNSGRTIRLKVTPTKIPQNSRPTTAQPDLVQIKGNPG